MEFKMNCGIRKKNHCNIENTKKENVIVKLRILRKYQVIIHSLK